MVKNNKPSLNRGLRKEWEGKKEIIRVIWPFLVMILLGVLILSGQFGQDLNEKSIGFWITLWIILSIVVNIVYHKLKY